jgi:redox-sensitive bicupin YhaK (pirin superfamily)
MSNPIIDIRRGGERFLTETSWLDSRHSFSFGPHYDPANTHHGLLLVSNEDIVLPGTGFRTHPHQDMEIVTWVLDGELEHKDSVGHHGVIYPGLAQRMSAGTGIYHSEMNPGSDKSVHFIQMWVLPDREGVQPGYQQLDVNKELDLGGLVPVASGRGDPAAIAIRQRDAVLWVGRLRPGETVPLPDARFLHLFIAKGSVHLEQSGPLFQGDAARIMDGGGLKLTADPAGGSEVLIWEMGR